MLARGIIEKIYGKNQVAVRIPLFDKSIDSTSRTPTDSLGIATICTLPNSTPNVRVGDVVYVGFENNDIYKPVILGYVYIDKEYTTKQGLSLESLDVDVNAKLPSSTTIGNVKPTEISYLSRLKAPIQEQIDNIETEIQGLEPHGGGGESSGPIEVVSTLDQNPTQNSPTFVIYNGQLYALVEE